MSAGNSERRQRIREQLREFYGDPLITTSIGNSLRKGQATTTTTNDNLKSGVPPEMDLDSEYFNVRKYITDLLRRESLKGLVETDTQLIRTVRHLDGELQELVYRNYAKFISATDTIREMRDNITEMDSKLQALSSNVENIDQVSKGISDKLQTHRSRIEKMISTNRMLRKVQFLVDLAGTMKRLIEKGEYSACVKYWIVGDSFLVKHANISSIAKIYEDCKILAQQLYNNLQETVFNTSLDDPEAMDVIRCVVEDMRLMRTTSLFQEEDNHISTNTNNSHNNSKKKGNNEISLSSFEVDILNTLMKNVSSSFSTGIQGVNSVIRAALAVPSFSAMDRTRWSNIIHNANLQEALAQLKSMCALFHSNSERVYSLFNRESDATVSLRIVQEVQPVLIDIMTPITTYMSELLISVVDAIGNDGENAIENPSEIENSLNTIFIALSKHLKYYSITLKNLGVNYLDNAHSQQSRQYAALVDQSVLDIFQNFIYALESKITEGPNFISNSNSNIPNVAIDSLYRKKLLQFCISRFIFSSAAIIADTVGIESLINTDTLKLTTTTTLRKQCIHIGHNLSNRGIILLGQLHLEWIAKECCPIDGIDPTSSVAQNNGIVPCLKEYAQELNIIYKILKNGVLHCGNGGGEAGKEKRHINNMRGNSMIYTSVGSGRSSGNVRTSRFTVNFTRQTGDALQTSVDRIFSKQSNSNSVLRTIPRDIHPASVMAATVVYVLKGLVEYVRQQCFTKYGFQYVQITCTFLLHILSPSYVSNSGPRSGQGELTVNTLEEWLSECLEESMLKIMPILINECCTCAYERCNEKLPLTAVVVEKLVKSVIDEIEGSEVRK